MNDTRKFHAPYKPRFASRKDFSHTKTFGATIPPTLPDELLKLPDSIIDQGDKPSCTAAASCTARNIMTGKIYDADAQWELELTYEGVKDSDGFALEVPAKVGKDLGFMVQGQPAATDKVGGYFFKNSKLPSMDWFDTLCYTQYQLFQQTGKVIPFQFGVNWYRSWDIPTGMIPSTNQDLLGGHDTTWAGYKIFPDGRKGVNPNTWGTEHGDKGYFYFDRATTNANIGPLGVFYWLDAEDMPPDVFRLGIFAAILQNIKAIFQLFLNYKNMPQPIPSPTPPPVPPTPPSKLIPFCKAIEEHENAPKIWNNPGAFRYNSYTKTFAGVVGKTLNGFCQFNDYNSGFNALKDFVIAAKINELKNYHDCTIASFFAVYSPKSDGNDPVIYANFVAQKVGQNVNDKLKDFI